MNLGYHRCVLFREFVKLAYSVDVLNRIFAAKGCGVIFVQGRLYWASNPESHAMNMVQSHRHQTCGGDPPHRYLVMHDFSLHLVQGC